MNQSLEATKAVLRVHMRAHRKGLTREHPEADWQAGDKAPEMLAGLKIRKPGVIAVYRSLGSEMDPRPLSEVMTKLGWTIALPVCEAFGEAVVFRGWKPGDRLAQDAAGVMAPLVSAPLARPDIVIVPLLAFDWRGGRLGQGQGYYDRTLAALRAERIVPCVGLAFAGQEIEEVPSEPHDEKLDAVLTEKGYRPLP